MSHSHVKLQISPHLILSHQRIMEISTDDVVFLVALGEVSSMPFFYEPNISSKIETNFSDLGGSWKTFSNLPPEARRCSDKPLFYQVSH